GQLGTGLGLTNVQRIVQQHHGYIRVESVVDRGTEVTMYLPSAAGQPLEEVAPPNPELPPIPILEGEPRLILVGWPHYRERNYLMDILQAYGYRACGAEGPAEAAALASAEAKRLALVIAEGEDKQLTAALKNAGCEAGVIKLGQGQSTSPGQLLRK